ncbi:MAG: hypothetical protein K6E20_06580 [Acholeplasmatales bacterium]|nr:hypothetical protein [Acholeplasmatales bacterium]
MRITEACKRYFEEELKKYDVDTVVINVSFNCCSPGLSLHIGFENNKDGFIVDGVKVFYNKGYEKEFENLVLDYKNGMIDYE